MIRVELISSAGCKKCATAKDKLKVAAQEVVGASLEWRDINVLDELDYAVNLGVLTLPAVAINGKLVFSSLPTPAQMRAELMKLAS
jgi:hypothetical protein